MEEGKEISQRTYLHVHGHRQQCGEGQGEGVGAVRWVEKGGKWGTSVIWSAIKQLAVNTSVRMYCMSFINHLRAILMESLRV